MNAKPLITRRTISKIARLDFSDLSHAQRIDAIARALGFDCGAALMSHLKAMEKESSRPSGEGPAEVVVVFGQMATSAISENEPLRDKYGCIDGDVVERKFNTKAELNAYLQGINDMDGWMEYDHVVDSIDEPDHPFFLAKKSNPKLSFVDWYESNLAAEMEEEEADEDKE